MNWGPEIDVQAASLVTGWWVTASVGRCGSDSSSDMIWSYWSGTIQPPPEPRVESIASTRTPLGSRIVWLR